MDDAKKTPLDGLHRALGGKMIAFAGWSLPAHYRLGVKDEHLHCRAKAALFDVSHMAQLELRAEDQRGMDAFDGAAIALERIVPSAIANLRPGKARYTTLLTDEGGIVDDLIAANAGDHLFAVVNASRRDADLAHLRATLPEIAIRERTDRALLALQGPAAAAVLAVLAPDALDLAFMETTPTTIAGAEARISRLGYTGEDGYEIALPAENAERVARLLLDDARVEAAGLGARDSLRLEAGLALYGAELDETTSPIEAGLSWIVPKRRREAGGFAGAPRVLGELDRGARRTLTGLRPEGRAPARAGTPIVDRDGRPIGAVTSGGFSPTLEGPISIGYVESEAARAGGEVGLVVRGKTMPAQVEALPFVPHNYKRR